MCRCTAGMNRNFTSTGELHCWLKEPVDPTSFHSLLPLAVVKYAATPGVGWPNNFRQPAPTGTAVSCHSSRSRSAQQPFAACSRRHCCNMPQPKELVGPALFCSLLLLAPLQHATSQDLVGPEMPRSLLPQALLQQAAASGAGQPKNILQLAPTGTVTTRRSPGSWSVQQPPAACSHWHCCNMPQPQELVGP
jgi:hypothetical protein